jgi:hypothetical protein
MFNTEPERPSPSRITGARVRIGAAAAGGAIAGTTTAGAPADRGWDGPGPWGAWTGTDQGLTRGEVTAADSSSITLSTDGGASVVVSTDAATTYDRLAKVSARAITVGEHLVAFGNPF